MGRSGGQGESPRVMPENRRPLKEGAVPPEGRRLLPLEDNSDRW